MSIDTDDIDPIGPDPQPTLEGFPGNVAIYGKPVRRYRITVAAEYAAPGPLVPGDSVMLKVQGVVEGWDFPPLREKMSKDGPAFLGPVSHVGHVKGREIIIESIEDDQGRPIRFEDGKRVAG